ncbi:MAG: tripartite tricarboxylate transporter permease [Acetobacteraceae bacterium]|nr:tripartite tricarboxylate transporter permease [Acetobacteraceae bacterium]MDW8398807.1 tripartite tricarboxylate transporter permease [Acetobacteraceae bacterium]
MTDSLALLARGLWVALEPANLALCLLGALLGTLVGVLPGLGPVTTIALLLPLTFHLPAAGALIMLAGIYYGAQYGSSTTAILLRVPGEASGIVTAQEGHLLARAGRAGPALGVAALASLLAGILAALLLALLLRPLADLAVAFGPAETAALMLLGIAAAVALSPSPLLPAWGLAVFGALLGLVGTDVAGGRPRFTFGVPELADGIGFVPLVIGVFGVAELIRALERERGDLRAAPVRSPWPKLRDMADAAGPAARGSAIGSVVGLLPGASTLLAALAAQAAERGLFRRKGRWGEGEMAGVAAPEAANNAASQTAFAPLLALGLPTSAVMAVLAGAMFLQGIAPGPAAIRERPEVIFALIASMLVGNLMLVALNLPLVGLWASLLRLPMRLLAALVMVLCCLGVYASSGAVFDLWLMLGFAVLGWALLRLGLDPSPLVIGFVLAAPFEEAMRRALILGGEDWSVFVSQPVSAALLAMAILVTGAALWLRR